jgi:hypothetical protein
MKECTSRHYCYYLYGVSSKVCGLHLTYKFFFALLTTRLSYHRTHYYYYYETQISFGDELMMLEFLLNSTTNDTRKEQLRKVLKF